MLHNRIPAKNGLRLADDQIMTGEDDPIHPHHLACSDQQYVSHQQPLLLDAENLSISLDVELLIPVLPLIFVDVEILNVDSGLEEDHDAEEDHGNEFLQETDGIV